ncbi:MAG TPA: hypothetical protein PK544_17325 [Spirochaetota bacterium]|nr:hypothetical protein [Spirochaetota bacterium]HPJ40149.1 hypothetical protein [Spirochaetota bacterium]HPQ54843.1 hypothetical protein [Spirochaetota bacterium]
MELTVVNIITNAVQKGLKYLVPVFVNAVLWVVTFWIPYLNVGTTIGLLVGIVAKMSRDEEVSMTEIFKPEYRKNMGEYFLVLGFMMAGIMAGMLFFYIPGFVIMVAWMLAPLLVIDKNMTPIDAISKSNVMTYGKKWVIFGSLVLLQILGFIALFIGTFIFGKIPAIGGFLSFIWTIGGMALIATVIMAAQSIIYGELSK